MDDTHELNKRSFKPVYKIVVATKLVTSIEWSCTTRFSQLTVQNSHSHFPHLSKLFLWLIISSIIAWKNKLFGTVLEVGFAFVFPQGYPLSFTVADGNKVVAIQLLML